MSVEWILGHVIGLGIMLFIFLGMPEVMKHCRCKRYIE